MQGYVALSTLQSGRVNIANSPQTSKVTGHDSFIFVDLLCCFSESSEYTIARDKKVVNTFFDFFLKTFPAIKKQHFRGVALRV
jgi:hypothetical protein